MFIVLRLVTNAVPSHRAKILVGVANPPEASVGALESALGAIHGAQVKTI